MGVPEMPTKRLAGHRAWDQMRRSEAAPAHLCEAFDVHEFGHTDEASLVTRVDARETGQRLRYRFLPSMQGEQPAELGRPASHFNRLAPEEDQFRPGLFNAERDKRIRKNSVRNHGTGNVRISSWANRCSISKIALIVSLPSECATASRTICGASNAKRSDL